MQTISTEQTVVQESQALQVDIKKSNSFSLSWHVHKLFPWATVSILAYLFLKPV